jgi:MFS transporter, DHA1 family, tetracycline resistance protein
VPPSAQGELQGAMTSLFSMTAIITPLIYTQIFAQFTGPNAPVEFGGAPYVLGGIFISIALIVFLLKVEKPQKPLRENETAAVPSGG